MSDAFYRKMQGVATKLLKKFGKVTRVQYMELTGGTKDTIFGGTDSPTYVSHNLVGVMTKLSDALLSKSDINAGDRMFISDSTIKPAASGYLIIEGERWNITVPDEINPAGLPVVYKTVVSKQESSVGTTNARS